MSVEINKVFISDKLEQMSNRQHLLCRLYESRLTLWQWGVLTIYLSMIDRREPEKIVVNIPDSVCTEIGRKDPKGWTWGATTVESERVILRILLENDDYLITPLFKDCSAYAEFENEEISKVSVKVCTSDLALPLLFGYQKYYFRHKVWHAMHLQNINHVRFYEKMKQYLDVGETSIGMNELRELLGVAPEKYKRWDNFRVRVLDNCQKAIETLTDIRVTYRIGCKSGRGGKIQDLIFTVTLNEDYSDTLGFEKYIDTQHVEKILNEEDEYYITSEQHTDNIEDNEIDKNVEISVLNDEFPLSKADSITPSDYEKMVRNSKLDYLRGACNDNFSIEEMGELIACMNERFDADVLNEVDLIICYKFLQGKHMKTWDKDIPNRLRYMKVLIMTHAKEK